MLENMNRFIEQMQALNKSLSIYAPKRKKNTESSSFKDELEQLMSPPPCIQDSSKTNSIDKSLGKSLNDEINSLVEKYSKEYKIEPNIIKQLISVASGNNPKAVGENGKLGLMQLNSALLSQYGVTNPFDPQQNISAGTQYLSQMLQNNNGNLSLALAAYNTDPLTVKRFGGVPPYLNTQNFVNNILNGLKK